MYSGDASGGGMIGTADINIYWSNEAEFKGCLTGDFNLNGEIDNIDKNDIWHWNPNKISQIPGSKENVK